MESNSKWVVIEGVDGVGKGTAVDIVSDILKKENVIITSALSAGPIGKTIKKDYVSKDHGDMKPKLITAMHLEQLCLVNTSLKDGFSVISDRALPSYYAYNVSSMSDDKDAIDTFNYLNRDGICRKPDLIIYIKASEETIIERMGTKNNKDHLDDFSMDSRKALLKGYDDYFYKHGLDIPFVMEIRNDGSLEHLRNQLCVVLTSIFDFDLGEVS